MKRIITYIAVATALLAISCTRESITESPSGKSKLTIQLISSELQTRAEKPGVNDPWKENTISWFDYFFFSDEEGTQLLYHDRVMGDTETFDTDEGDPFEDLRDGAYVYVLANYPTDIPTGVDTISEILELPLSTNFQAGYDGRSLSFVMDNYANGSLTRVKASKPNDETEVDITLSRIASKLTMTINVLKQITETSGEVWTPVLDSEHFFAYFVNADKTNTVAATPQSRADEESDGYFTYDTDHGYKALSDTTVNGKSYYRFLTDPAYTYPQTWNGGANGEPYFKIQMGWDSTIKGMGPYYYKIAIPIADEDGVFTLNRNTWYHLTVYVTVLGGAESDYVLVDNIYCVADFADWTTPSEEFSSQGSSARYFDVPTLSYDLYSLDELKINFICDADHTAVAEILSVNYYDYSTSSATGTEVIRQGTNSSSAGYTAALGDGTLNDASNEFSYTEPIEERIYKLEVVDDGENKYVKFTHDISNIYVQRVIKVRIFKSDEPNVYRDVTIIQHPAIELKKTNAGDVFVNGHFARVQNATFGTSWTYDGVTYYHSNNGALAYNSNNYSVNYGWGDNRVARASISGESSGTNGYGSVFGKGTLSGNISSNFYTTDVTVTAFSSTNNTYEVDGSSKEYKIGDPRVKASTVYPTFSLNNYLYGNNQTRSWSNAGDILICSQSDNIKTVIAPHILISSSLNAMGTNQNNNSPHALTFDNAVKRAATYQEAGYPAGRWRLPTEAEVAFIISRQNDGTIPILFAKGSDYWCASGLITAGTNSVSTKTYSSTATYSARFVYDLWYWGDKPLDKADKTNPNATPLSTNVYHPNQHEF